MVVTNPDGKITSANYTAKSMGVKRGEGRQWLEDARALCLRAGTELMEITPGDALQNWMSLKLGKNSTSIDDIHRAVRGGLNLGAAFQELGFSNYKKKAKDLYKKCQFEDDSRVTSKVHPDSINTSLSFKEGGERKVDFDEGVSNMSQDMKGRLDYYRRIYGRTAKKLIVQFTHTDARTRTGPSKSARMDLSQDAHNQFVSHKSIRDFILDNILRNGLYWKNLAKINLTASYITDKDIGANRSEIYTQLQNYEFVGTTGYAVPV